MKEPAEIETYFDRLWPLLRSITGEGVRQTLKILSELIPLEIIETPSGTAVFDWTIPKEWVVREAYVIDPQGRRILDVQTNNLHLLNYSIPFSGTVTRAELDSHLHSLPEIPDAIPYITSYYEPRWGFCLSENERKALPEGNYLVRIDTDHIDGAMTMGEAVLAGEEADEVLISTYVCHPSLANNELSGPLVAAFLYRRLAAIRRRRLTYRFVFLPETIGSIAYLSFRGEHLKQHLVAGYVVTCIGDGGAFTYKRSRRGNSDADRAATHVLAHAGLAQTIVDFFPQGSDERQYCSPGFNLPVGSLMRSMYGRYREYHTSLDNRAFISFDAMGQSIQVYFDIMQVLDMNAMYSNLLPYGEAQLGRRGLCPTLGAIRRSELLKAIKWVLNFSDGQHDLLAIAERSGLTMELLDAAARAVSEVGLLGRIKKPVGVSRA